MPLLVGPMDVEDLRRQEYDLLLVALGYEARSRHFVTTTEISATRRVAVAFQDRHVLDYAANELAMKERGFEIVQGPEDGLLDKWQALLAVAEAKACSESRVPRIVVDISSMSRGRIGSLVQVLSGGRVSVDVVFVYSIGKYDPDEVPREMVYEFGPLSPWYMGQVDSPRNPIQCIIGLGVERFAVLGVIEFFEPQALQIFVPTADDDEYKERTDDVVRDLLGGVKPSALVRYPVDSPYASFAMLNSCVSASAFSSGRAIIVPFGPKVFSLVAALVAAEHWPRVAVWRVTGSTKEPPVQRYPSGPVVALHCKFVAAGTG
jgi:hypothetical protein